MSLLYNPFFLIAMFCLAAAIVCAWMAVRERRILSRLAQFGVIINAETVRLSAVSRNDRRYSGHLYYLTYQFSLENGTSFSRKQVISRITYANLTHGSRIPFFSRLFRMDFTKYVTKSQVSVSYLPMKPRISRLAGADVDNTRLLFMNQATAMMSAVTFVVLIYALLR